MTRQDTLRRAMIFLATAGLIDAIYLAFVKLSNQKGLCLQGLGDCWTVNTSKYSEFMGIPVSLLGASAYIFILILLLLEAKGTFWRENSALFVFGLTLAGILYSAYLTYLEIAVIRAICPFCVLSATLMAVLFGLAITRLVKHQQNLILD
jgi:uncharacterized membrane protein